MYLIKSLYSEFREHVELVNLFTLRYTFCYHRDVRCVPLVSLHSTGGASIYCSNDTDDFYQCFFL